MKKLKILMTNDDGIEFSGFRLLVKKLGARHEVYAFAPHIQRSACSLGLTVYAPFSYSEVKLEGAALACAVEGTPGDCVKFAVKYFNIPFDLVVAGPNHGSNLGTDILYSGTVGGATEGAILGLNSIAFSQCLPMESFEDCTDFIDENLERLITFRKPETFLNVNLPALPRAEYKGVGVSRQGVLQYSDYYDRDYVEEKYKYRLKGEREMEKSATHGSDVSLINGGYVSVTPIMLNRTDESAMTAVEELIGSIKV